MSRNGLWIMLGCIVAFSIVVAAYAVRGPRCGVPRDGKCLREAMQIMMLPTGPNGMMNPHPYITCVEWEQLPPIPCSGGES